MTVKTYASRDSATSTLRKLGILTKDYNLFITKTGGKFECDLGAAAKHLQPTKTKVAKKPTDKVQKPKVKPARESVSSVARSLIFTGKTNDEIWEVLQARFNLDRSKRHYPTWYRCEMKRKGLLPQGT